MTLRAARWGISLVAFLLAALALAQTRVVPPDETAAGGFEGTWYRIDPDNHQAVQFRRGPNGKGWEVRFYWQTTMDQFQIDTNWRTRTEFAFKGYPGARVLDVDQKKSTPSRILIHYHRDQDGADKSHLTEEGDVLVYRAGEGRNLVWRQEPLRTKVKISEPIAPYEEDGANTEQQRLWIFMKASRRLIPWDEIPW
jgi:hypothetical protein